DALPISAPDCAEINYIVGDVIANDLRDGYHGGVVYVAQGYGYWAGFYHIYIILVVPGGTYVYDTWYYNDDAQGDAYFKFGDIKGEYRLSDDLGDTYFKFGDIKGEYRLSDDAQGDAFVKIGDIKGEYRADDDAQGDAYIKIGDIKGEAYADDDAGKTKF
ncbi:MAG: hypothetical protein VCG02_00050, partial [Verrucomicrobiota bacterium]